MLRYPGSAFAIALTFCVASLAQAQVTPNDRRPDGRIANQDIDFCSGGLSDLTQLHNALAESESEDIGFEVKRRKGYFQAPPISSVPTFQRPPEVLLDQIRRNLGRLDQDGSTAALLYRVERTRDAYVVCALLITTQDFLSDHVESPADRTIAQISYDELNLATRSATRVPTRRGLASTRLEAGESKSAGREALDNVARTLLPPKIREKITSGRLHRLLILASSDLSTVPFAALPISDKDLVDYVSIVMLADVDGLLSTPGRRTNFSDGAKVIVGDPDFSDEKDWKFYPLASARIEAAEVARLFSDSALTGKAASHGVVLAKLKQPNLKLAYFATHGVADSINPMDGSFLALSQGHLFADEIKRLDLNKTRPLVVMSACQSGLGKVFDGGVFGGENGRNRARHGRTGET